MESKFLSDSININRNLFTNFNTDPHLISVTKINFDDLLQDNFESESASIINNLSSESKINSSGENFYGLPFINDFSNNIDLINRSSPLSLSYSDNGVYLANCSYNSGQQFDKCSNSSVILYPEHFGESPCNFIKISESNKSYEQFDYPVSKKTYCTNIISEFKTSSSENLTFNELENISHTRKNSDTLIIIIDQQKTSTDKTDFNSLQNLPPKPPPLPPLDLKLITPNYNSNTRSNKFKRIPWQTISSHRVFNNTKSIWTTLAFQQRDNFNYFDVSTLEELFSLKTSNCKTSKQNTNHFKKDFHASNEKFSHNKNHSNKRESKDQNIFSLDYRKSLNISIILKQMKQPVYDIIENINSLLKYDKDDQYVNLIKALPSTEELLLMSNFEGDIGILNDVQKFCFLLSKQENIKEKVELIILQTDINLTIDSMKTSISFAIITCKAILKSSNLQKLFFTILTTGNHLNSGNTVAFRISSLLTLNDIKANKNDITLLHYILEILEEQDIHFPILDEEFKNIKEASLFSKAHCFVTLHDLEAKLLSFTQGSITVKNEQLQKIIKNFNQESKDKLNELRLNLDKLKRMEKEIAEYLCEDESQFMLEECLKTLLTFFEKTRKSYQENQTRKVNSFEKEKKYMTMSSSDKSKYDKLHTFGKSTENQGFMKSWNTNKNKFLTVASTNINSICSGDSTHFAICNVMSTEYNNLHSTNFLKNIPISVFEKNTNEYFAKKKNDELNGLDSREIKEKEAFKLLKIEHYNKSDGLINLNTLCFQKECNNNDDGINKINSNKNRSILNEPLNSDEQIDSKTYNNLEVRNNIVSNEFKLHKSKSVLSLNNLQNLSGEDKIGETDDLTETKPITNKNSLVFKLENTSIVLSKNDIYSINSENQKATHDKKGEIESIKLLKPITYLTFSTQALKPLHLTTTMIENNPYSEKKFARENKELDRSVNEFKLKNSDRNLKLKCSFRRLSELYTDETFDYLPRQNSFSSFGQIEKSEIIKKTESERNTIPRQKLITTRFSLTSSFEKEEDIIEKTPLGTSRDEGFESDLNI